jgi:hypothetical protein
MRGRGPPTCSRQLDWRIINLLVHSEAHVVGGIGVYDVHPILAVMDLGEETAATIPNVRHPFLDLHIAAMLIQSWPREKLLLIFSLVLPVNVTVSRLWIWTSDLSPNRTVPYTARSRLKVSALPSSRGVQYQPLTSSSSSSEWRKTWACGSWR